MELVHCDVHSELIPHVQMLDNALGINTIVNTHVNNRIIINDIDYRMKKYHISSNRKEFQRHNAFYFKTWLFSSGSFRIRNDDIRGWCARYEKNFNKHQQNIIGPCCITILFFLLLYVCNRSFLYYTTEFSQKRDLFHRQQLYLVLKLLHRFKS